MGSEFTNKNQFLEVRFPFFGRLIYLLGHFQKILVEGSKSFI